MGAYLNVSLYVGVCVRVCVYVCEWQYVHVCVSTRAAMFN